MCVTITSLYYPVSGAVCRWLVAFSSRFVSTQFWEKSLVVVWKRPPLNLSLCHRLFQVAIKVVKNCAAYANQALIESQIARALNNRAACPGTPRPKADRNRIRGGHF